MDSQAVYVRGSQIPINRKNRNNLVKSSDNYYVSEPLLTRELTKVHEKILDLVDGGQAIFGGIRI